ncbi:MAG: sulfatase-like hydrolase/transferase [Planctomycetota bacterium]
MPDQPNILIFMTDHQRADTVLAEHPAVTPNLDGLARQGVTFTETYGPAPHCCPARATFMTGLYPSRHGVWNNICNERALSRGLNEDVRCWSEDLADAGYRLAYSGKWHVSVEESPADRGFEELKVTGGPGAYHGRKWDAYRELAEKPEPAERGEGQILRPGWSTYTAYGSFEKTEEVQTGDDDTVHRALEALPRLAEDDRPWCLSVNCGMPHDPYNVPERYLDMYDLAEVPLPPSYEDDMSGKPRVVQRMRQQVFGQLSEREVREAIRHFWAMCTYLDDLFGKLLARLEELGRAEDTLVLYTADHGDYCGDHGLFAKGIPCYEGAYHVPAVVRWPAGIADPGRRVEEFVSLADFAPTFTELAGGTPDPDLTGRSLVPFMRNERPEEWRDAIFTQCDGVELYYSQRSVMTKEFKYVFNGFDFDELYDLRDDPHEMHNVIDEPGYREVVRRMCRRLWRFAVREDDSMRNGYITVGLMPYGPAEGFR